MRPEECELKLGHQGVEVCDHLDDYQTRKYLNYLIQNIQIFAPKSAISCIESEMAVHLDAIIKEDN